MKINTALILCAGLGKRLNPITLNTPKPLLKIKDVSMLERCINLIEKLGIQKIFINTFYLKDQFSKFLDKKNFNLDINIIEDGKHILDTGGGIQNMVKDCDENNFFDYAADAGAEDISSEDDAHVAICKSEEFGNVRDTLSSKIGDPSSAKLEWVPQNYQQVNQDDAEKIIKFIDVLEDNDDVQNVYTNFEISDEIMEKIANK